MQVPSKPAEDVPNAEQMERIRKYQVINAISCRFIELHSADLTRFSPGARVAIYPRGMQPFCTIGQCSTELCPSSFLPPIHPSTPSSLAYRLELPPALI